MNLRMAIATETHALLQLPQESAPACSIKDHAGHVILFFLRVQVVGNKAAQLSLATQRAPFSPPFCDHLPLERDVPLVVRRHTALLSDPVGSIFAVPFTCVLVVFATILPGHTPKGHKQSLALVAPPRLELGCPRRAAGFKPTASANSAKGPVTTSPRLELGRPEWGTGFSGCGCLFRHEAMVGGARIELATSCL